MVGSARLNNTYVLSCRRKGNDTEGSITVTVIVSATKNEQFIASLCHGFEFGTFPHAKSPPPRINANAVPHKRANERVAKKEGERQNKRHYLFREEQTEILSNMVRRLRSLICPSVVRKICTNNHYIIDSNETSRPGLSQEEVGEIQQAFKLFDTNGSGTIDLNELKCAIEGLGTQSKNQLIVQMMDDIENSTNRQIDFEEFLDLMTATIGSTDTKEETSRVFNLFDDDRTGYISLDNLKRVAYDLGETMDDAELLEMIERTTENREGVTFDDFFSIMNKKTFG
eukprot:scaffold44262_cov52-Attheya_sp.AAC.2